MFRGQPDFVNWWEERRKAHAYEVTVVGLEQLTGWRFDPDYGDRRHYTGNLFSVGGADVTTDFGGSPSWSQPILVQPEVGILGILATRIDGLPNYQMQAKIGPDNVNVLQFSPTVRATRSNYTGIHGGRPVPCLEYFVTPRPGGVLFDTLQSEQGSWFLAKRNRNIIVEADADVPVYSDFRWCRMDEIEKLLHVDNLVNIDARTVLSGLPGTTDEGGPDAACLHTTAGGWSPPMLAPTSQGVIAFLAEWINGTAHVLVQLRTDTGTHDVVEVAATVNCAPANYQHLQPGERPRFLDEVLSAPPERVLLDVVLSAERGRFYAAQNQYRIVEVEDGFPIDVPVDFAWMTSSQLANLPYGNHVAVCARSLLSCVA